MKKTKLLMSALFATAIFFTSSLHAQQLKGTNFVNVGVGIGTYGFSGTGRLPIVATIEHGFSDKISAGVYGGFIQRNYDGNLKYSYKVFGVKGSYHFNDALNIANPNVDVYGGAALYYRSFTLKYKDSENPEYSGKSTGGDLGIGIFAGGRYLFAKNAGVFAEIGYGISPLQVGLTLKF